MDLSLSGIPMRADYNTQNKDSVDQADKVGAVWIFKGQVASGDKTKPNYSTRVINFTARDGVADLKLWHKRLVHVCPQYIKLMVDRKLVDGMLLYRRNVRDCETCHMAKKVRKTLKKAGHIVMPDQLVYADLLVPGVNCDT